MPMADAVEALPPPEHGGESGRSSPSPAASPEFEFWMVGQNPAPALLTADELFYGGVVLPLHNLQASSPTDADGDGSSVVDAPAVAEPAEAETEAAQPLAESGIAPTPDLPAVTFKWKDIFKANGGEAKERKKTERRVSSVSGNAELININIWPFSRSRSAGHGATVSLSKAKPSPSAIVNSTGSGGGGVASNASSTATAPATSAPALAPAPRKVSSAPCSRSNSRGDSGPEQHAIPAVAAAAATVEAAAGAQTAPSPGSTSMLRRLVPGHGRNNTGAGTGIRLGRPSPVWQLRRNKLQQAATEQKQAGAKKKAAAPASAPAGASGSDDNATAAAAPSVGAPAAAGCRNNAGCSEGGEEGANPPPGLFGLRTFFSKKVY